MARCFFEEQEVAALNQKFSLSSPAEINNLILNYLQRKKGKSFSLAVDVGCGSGQSSRGLASYFEKVVGIDMSAAQIEEAKKLDGPDNVSYRVGLAEELEFEDGSVNLVTVGAAAHWFDMKKFMKEVDRILKPKGCIALYCYTVPHVLHNDDCSEDPNQIVQDLFTTLAPCENKRTKVIWNEYKEIFDAITFPDKERAEDIDVKFKMPVPWIIGFLKAYSLYQAYLRKDPENAKASLERTEQRFPASAVFCFHSGRGPVARLDTYMARCFFEEQELAALYQKFRLPSPAEINNLILNYLQRKKGKPFSLAVDVGCGSGQSSQGLASYFEKVVGIDMSGAQIEEAKKLDGPDNVSYRVGLAEELEFEDGSIDLVTVGAAAHWFDMEKFMKEVDRILKPKGCIALYCYRAPHVLHNDDCSKDPNQFVQDLFTTLNPGVSKATKIVWNEYKEIFDAITFPDKERAEDIYVKFKMPVPWMIGFLKSLSLYQAYLRKDPENAKASLERTEQSVDNLNIDFEDSHRLGISIPHPTDRLLKALGVSSETAVEFSVKYFCLLASKPERCSQPSSQNPSCDTD